MSVLESIRTFLPPPHYLELPSVGVDISDTSLKYIQFKPSARRAGTLSISHYGDIAIEAGTLERGVVKDVEKLASALAEVRKRTGAAYVRLSLPEERAYLFETEIKKGTPFGEVRGLLEFRLEENVPLSPRDAYFDYLIYPLAGARDKLGVSVTAYGCDTINSYYEICRKAQVTPLAFEVEAYAIARAVIPRTDRKGAKLIVDCGKTRTGIGIVLGDILMYTSTIDIGGKELSAALRKQLGDKTEDELTMIKNTQGLERTAGKEVHEALIGTVSAIKGEIAQRIQYWNTRGVGGEDRYVAEIILCGGSSNLKGFPEYLRETLGIETRLANVWQNAFDLGDTVPPIDRAHAYGYATAIGLALGNLR